MPHPTDEQIRARAHQLWEEAGCPDGQAEDFWHRAERELSDAADGPSEMIEPTPTLFPG